MASINGATTSSLNQHVAKDPEPVAQVAPWNRTMKDLWEMPQSLAAQLLDDLRLGHEGPFSASNACYCCRVIVPSIKLFSGCELLGIRNVSVPEIRFHGQLIPHLVIRARSSNDSKELQLLVSDLTYDVTRLCSMSLCISSQHCIVEQFCPRTMLA